MCVSLQQNGFSEDGFALFTSAELIFSGRVLSVLVTKIHKCVINYITVAIKTTKPGDYVLKIIV